MLNAQCPLGVVWHWKTVTAAASPTYCVFDNVIVRGSMLKYNYITNNAKNGQGQL